MKPSLTIRNISSFVVVSGLFGIATIPNYMGYYPGASFWLVALVIGMLFGFLLYVLVFGGVGLVVASFVSESRRPKASSQTETLDKSLQKQGDVSDRQVFIATRIMLPVVGLLLGVLFAYGFLKLPFGFWQKLEPAPQPVVALMDNVMVDIDDNALFVMAEDNQIYAYNCPFMRHTCSWLKSEQSPKPIPASQFRCGVDTERKNLTPWFLGTVSQHVVFGICGGESVRMDHFLLSADGSVWHWIRWSSAYDFILFAPLVVVAGLVASGTGTAILLVDKRLLE